MFQLISEAIRHGPQSQETMEMADWWLEEKQLVHKLFKVLVPRFQHFPASFTTLYQAPYWHFSDGFQPQLNAERPDRAVNEAVPEFGAVVHKKAVLELKGTFCLIKITSEFKESCLSNKFVVSGHPYPPMFPTKNSNPQFLQNVLLSSAKAYFKSLPSQPNIGDTKQECQDSTAGHETDPDELECTSESKK